jgi:hypothetical protein
MQAERGEPPELVDALSGATRRAGRVSKKNSVGLLGLKAPSSGRTNVIAFAASLAASSWTSVRAPAFGIGNHSPVTEPVTNVRSLLRAGSRERKTYSVPSTSPFRSRTALL